MIGCSPTKFFHLKEFAENLKKKGVECKLVIDTSVYTGFPSKNMTKWFETKGKFNDLIKQFQPDAVFVDRQTNFGLVASKLKIPLFKSQVQQNLFCVKMVGAMQKYFPSLCLKRIFLAPE